MSEHAEELARRGVQRRKVRIVHDEHGTRLERTQWGDGAWSMLRGTWEHQQGGVWWLPGSAGRPADAELIARTARALRAIGFDVDDE